MVILGIDPGLAETGWGVAGVQSSKLKVQSYGCVVTRAREPIEERLKEIYEGIAKVIEEHQPEVAAVEDLFFGANTKTAMLVGQARGVIILACGLAGVPVREFTPLQIKTALTGYGRAEKGQMQRMVKTILGLEEIPQPDHAADALACAYTCWVHKGPQSQALGNS